jgi:arylsulfate sulfotransferase
LYAGISNSVTISLSNKEGKTYTGEFQVETEPLPNFFPDIEIVKLDRQNMEPGFHLIELLIANNGLFHSYTVMFDDNADVRWYMDMSSAKKISYSPLRLKNGNWLYLSWIDLYEIDELGKVIRKDQMWGNAGDHHVIELPNGNLLMGGSKKDAMVKRGDGEEVATRYDYVVEWNRVPPGKTFHEWDLGEILDIDRSVFPDKYSLDFKADWFHVNSVDINLSDRSIIASGRNQGVVKVDALNQVQWILAPHQAWGKSGRQGTGEETSKYLLTAVDKDGSPLSDHIQMGTAAATDFEWSTGQHAVTRMDNGNILLFDNGLSRNFAEKPMYSRAVEYKIDEDKMTIQQVWEYGKERGLDMFSGITSDVDILPLTNIRLITAGNVRLGTLPPHCKMIELTYPNNDVVFEANIFFKDANGSGARSWAQFDLVYRGQRYPLFH